MLTPSLLKKLFLFVKLAYEVFRIRIVEENEYKYNHEKGVERQRQGRILKKLLIITGNDIIFKYNNIGAVIYYDQDTKEKGKSEVDEIACAVAVNSEDFITLCETYI